MSKDKSSFGFGMGLLAGVVGGIIAGILYAPRPGSEMREMLKSKKMRKAKELEEVSDYDF